jgi:hypothetical protein
LTVTPAISSHKAEICRRSAIDFWNFGSTENISVNPSRRKEKIKSGCRMPARSHWAGKPGQIFNSPASASGRTPKSPSTKARAVMPMESPKSRCASPRAMSNPVVMPRLPGHKPRYMLSSKQPLNNENAASDWPVTQWAVGLAFKIAFGPVYRFRRVRIGGAHECRGQKRQRQQDGRGFHVCPEDACDFAANPPARQFLSGQIRSRTSCHELCL